MTFALFRAHIPSQHYRYYFIIIIILLLLLFYTKEMEYGFWKPFRI